MMSIRPGTSVRMIMLLMATALLAGNAMARQGHDGSGRAMFRSADKHERTFDRKPKHGQARAVFRGAKKHDYKFEPGHGEYRPAHRRAERRSDHRHAERHHVRGDRHRVEHKRHRKHFSRGSRHYRPPSRVVIRTLPYGYDRFRHHRQNYYFSGGWWYEPWGSSYVRITAPIGVVVSSLPVGYVTLNVGGHVHYRYRDTWYRRHDRGYIVVDAPDDSRIGETASVDDDTLFAYPNKGQSERQQADDRFECHEWAADQSNYDPSLTPAAGASRESRSKRPRYLRAFTACLEGRDYTVR